MPRPRVRPLPSYQTWPCVILAVDPGASTGAALVVSRPGRDLELVRVGDVPAGTEPAWVELATDTALAAELPLIVVAETWTFGRGPHERMGSAAQVGLAAAWGRWPHLFDPASLRLAEARLFVVRTLRVNASTWHARMLGGGRGVPSAEWKRRARLRCERVHGAAAVAGVSDDAAEALVIAEWASRAGEVGRTLPVRVLRAHGLEVPA